MRRLKVVAIAAVAVALVFSSVPIASAGMFGRMRGHGAPYRITRPSVASAKVVMGTSFDATGALVPAIAADDASTTVAIEVYGKPVRGHRGPLMSVPAALAASPDTGTTYAATLTLADAGEYQLVAAVSLDGTVIARSKPREIRVVLPYKVTKPRLVSPKVTAGESFDATGVVVPAIAADDASTTVAIRVLKVGRHGRLTAVDSVDAVLTGDVDSGTGYSASLTLADTGKYVLVAVVLRDGVVLGRSAARPVKVRPAEPLPAASAVRHGHSG